VTLGEKKYPEKKEKAAGKKGPFLSAVSIHTAESIHKDSKFK
jgi:hypothetical protein